MDPITTSVLTSIFANFATDAVKHLFSEAFKARPELQKKLEAAESSYDFEAVFREITGVIDVNAASGAISIDGALLEALRGIRFDHGHGTVHIAGTTLNASVLVTGGGSNSSGKTVIGENTLMKSGGTSISVGTGCSIVMTGGAQIRQN